VFALSYREHFRRLFAFDLRPGLLALLAADSGEGFPKIGINALRVTKGSIEYGFHDHPCTVVVPYQ